MSLPSKITLFELKKKFLSMTDFNFDTIALYNQEKIVPLYKEVGTKKVKDGYLSVDEFYKKRQEELEKKQLAIQKDLDNQLFNALDKKRSCEEVKRILENGSNPNAQTEKLKLTPLHSILHDRYRPKQGQTIDQFLVNSSNPLSQFKEVSMKKLSLGKHHEAPVFFGDHVKDKGKTAYALACEYYQDLEKSMQYYEDIRRKSYWISTGQQEAEI